MASDKGELMSDPYASGGSGSAAAPPPLSTRAAPPASSAGWSPAALPSAAPMSPRDYLFEVEERRSAGERLQYHVGCAYLTGLLGGGSAGLVQGLRESAGERRSIRINSVLNAAGRKGPGLANSLGCVAMMCSIFESIAYNARGTDDLLNPAGAAALTGTLYKITSVRVGPSCVHAAARFPLLGAPRLRVLVRSPRVCDACPTLP